MKVQSSNHHQVTTTASSGNPPSAKAQMEVQPRRVARDFPDRGPQLPSVQSTDTLPPAAPWSVGETMGYYATAPFWWVRRIVKDRRETDTNEVFEFLKKNRYIGDNRCFKAASLGKLVRQNITKKFWWISHSQINNVAQWTKDESSAFPPIIRSKDEMKSILSKKLFSE